MGILDNIKSSLGMKAFNSKKSKGQTLGGGANAKPVYGDHKPSGKRLLHKRSIRTLLFLGKLSDYHESSDCIGSTVSRTCKLDAK